MENEIKPITKEELIKKIEEYKPKYIYQRYNGEIRQFGVIDNNYLVDTKTGMSFDFRSHLILRKVSENLIDLIQCGDYVNGYKVEKTDNGVIYCCESNGYYEEIIWKNEGIKTVVTKEMMKSIEYRVNRDMETN